MILDLEELGCGTITAGRGLMHRDDEPGMGHLPNSGNLRYTGFSVLPMYRFYRLGWRRTCSSGPKFQTL